MFVHPEKRESGTPPSWTGVLYAGTARPTPPAVPLAHDVRIETLVIGGGFTGLSTALHLAEAGHGVVLVEAGDLAAGASGRCGGQVNPGLMPFPSEVEQHFAADAGRQLAVAAWNAPDLVFSLIERHAIACEAVRGGTIQAARVPAHVPELERLMAECRARGSEVEWLTRDRMAARTGTNRYPAGLLDRRGGQINPLGYARGLAEAAQKYGAALHPKTRVTGLFREDTRWIATTANGYVIQAHHVVIATNAYSDDIWPRLRRSLIPLYSAIIASEPLAEGLHQTILARREVLHEMGHIAHYYRVDGEGRLLMGGCPPSRDLVGAEAFPHLREQARALWPELMGIRWSHGWNGQFARTWDRYPYWHEHAPGIVICVGYNGRGIAMATMMGREIAHHVRGTAHRGRLLPATPLRPVPFQPLWRLGAAVGFAIGTWRDRRESGDGRPLRSGTGVPPTP